MTVTEVCQCVPLALRACVLIVTPGSASSQLLSSPQEMVCQCLLLAADIPRGRVTIPTGDSRDSRMHCPAQVTHHLPARRRDNSEAFIENASAFLCALL